jgi:hypothetical protein
MTRTFITNQRKLVRIHSESFWCWDKPRALRTTRLTTARTREYATAILLIVYSATLRRTHIQMAQIPGTPKLDSRNPTKCPGSGLPGLWEGVAPRPDLGSRRGFNRSCSRRRDLSNDVSHSRIGHQERVDSRLLVVGSQIASLTPGPFFAHILGWRCPNRECEGIFDIYVSRPFQ